MVFNPTNPSQVKLPGDVTNMGSGIPSTPISNPIQNKMASPGLSSSGGGIGS